MTRPSRLTARFIEQVKTPGRYGDGRGGHGLSLRVRASSDGKRVGKTWEQRVWVNGHVTTLGLGTFPDVKLADARLEAAAKVQRIRAAAPPRLTALDRLLGDRVAVDTRVAPTFREMAEEWLEAQRAGWKPGSKTESGYRALLDTYINPVIGGTPVDKVTPDQVYQILSPLWDAQAPTAKKMRPLLSGVFRLVITKEYRDDDPVQRGSLALGKQRHKTEHLPALPYEKAGEAIAFIRRARADAVNRLALEFLILTAVRTSDVRKMRAREIDLETRTWTLPPETPKGGRQLRVPLSNAAVSVLVAAGLYRCQPHDLVFKSKRETKQEGWMMGRDVLRKLFKKGFPDYTVHGFRSTFRDWVTDETDYPSELAEHALAHLEGSETVRAYARSDMFNKRRAVMDDWAAYIERGV